MLSSITDNLAYTIISQGLGFIAMGLLFFAYALKSRKKILFFKLTADVFWVIHMILLGAASGAVINALNVGRETVLFNSNKKWAKSRAWEWIFLVVICGATLLFWEGYFSLFAVVGAGFEVIALFSKSTVRLRIFLLFSVPFWLVYGIISTSYSIIIANLISAVIVTLALIRDIKERKNNRKAISQENLMREENNSNESVTQE